MILKVTNDSTSVIIFDDLSGFQIDIGQTIDLGTIFNKIELSQSDSLLESISTSQVIINNGDNDLSKIDSLKYIFDQDLNTRIDGKLLVQSTSRKPGTSTYFSSEADNPNDVKNIGGGNKFDIIHYIGDSTNQSYIFDLNIIENPTWLHQGYVLFKNAFFDKLTFNIIPRYISVDSTSNTDFQLYNGYLVIPASDSTGNITFDQTAILEPNGGLVYMPMSGNTRPTAFWNADWNSITKKFENLQPAPYGNGIYNIFTYPVVLNRYVNKLSLLGSDIIKLATTEVKEIGHGMRIEIIAETYIPDHDWFASIILVLNRENTI